ncbi:cysteine methyltransferase [Moraxella osloensis]|nr:methylated-DNA--[protein]-cysteine S-methyltransferase [Moraxella osloensis]AME02186.1 cysteine methyltransferase [Moraxella osloensis]OBX51367.1 cysteine methyltransferase [Moraxella osloensis]QPT42046.1 methylated-DNA--[protein]-cysteine S-methyltransferase [Moraxella osloensis]
MIMTSYQLAKNLPTVTLVAHQGCLIALDWHTQKTHDLLAKLKVKVAVMNSVALSHSIDADAKVLVETITQLKEYQVGQRQVFDMPIAIATGTPFQQKVWQALRQIPYGQTISYAQLAKQVDSPKGFRAVAQANGRNPLSLIIPCHRVIASDGKLGGYTGGVEIKQTLLDIEQASYQR